MRNRTYLFLLSLFLFTTACGPGAGDRQQDENGHGHMMETDEHDPEMGPMGREQGELGDETQGRRGMMGEDMERAMMSDNMGPGMMEDMRQIHTLMMQHEAIDRRVERIDGGVKTWTTSEDPQIAEAIKVHVRQMKERMEEGRPIRQRDPLFRALFDHADEIDLQLEEVPGGIVATETSDNPRVVALIRQHAEAAVSEFVEEGMNRAMETTPLPEGYQE